MSIVSDLVIARPADAKAIVSGRSFFRRWQRVQFDGLDNMALADLLAALAADDDAEALRGEGRLVYMKAKEGPWVFHLPDSFRNALAALQDGQVSAVAERWVAGEEMAFHRVQGADVEPTINQLRDFSKRALAAKKPLLLVMSL